MKKDDAKVLLSSVYDEILAHIDRNDDQVDEELLIDFLHDIANAVIKSDFNKSFDFYSQQLTFEDEYKLLAEQSLHSYSNTSDKFAELTKEQLKALDELHESKIDITAVTDRFASIQSDLHGEISQANSTISELIQRVKELENKAAIDPLTKVYNRRGLDSYLDTIINHHHQKDLVMHLYMIDIDDFKKVNDTYGHLVGDKVLIFVANMLKKTLRDGDKVFRFGGEEFVIVLNRITHEGCKMVAERLLDLVRNNKLISQSGQISVTMSIGATQFKTGDTIETLIQRADEALYLAKENGKDQLKVKT
ncbi:MAG: GGDEF domain-containing protein [Campylobacterota bacterium]|nr:GGDEF domain-containing protein [Campylobacterota bacterium]